MFIYDNQHYYTTTRELFTRLVVIKYIVFVMCFGCVGHHQVSYLNLKIDIDETEIRTDLKNDTIKHLNRQVK